MDIIVIGAGAAGLMAAKELSSKGLKVCILEARDRIGGRIHTVNDTVIKRHIEGGAEFIHGNLDVTFQLLKEAGLSAAENEGEVFQIIDGKWNQNRDYLAYSDEIIERLKEVKEDISIKDFLQKYFADEKYEALRVSLKSYVEGYYSGEIEKTSALSFLEEWETEDDQQYRPAEGYGKLMQYLGDECINAGALIQLSTVVKEIRWSRSQVEVIDETHHSYIAHKALITVPVGVWCADEQARSAIKYTPALPGKLAAAKKLGFGAVIKVLSTFKEMFWENKEIKQNTGVAVDQFHMALSDLTIPTWWTQLPVKNPLLTGWLSGPAAKKLKDKDDQEILNIALDSLSNLFSVEIDFLKEKLISGQVFNWTNDPFTLGSYSYSTLDTPVARQTLLEPVDNTLFFAGEGLYDGPEMGTVEAALTSGKEVAKVVWRDFYTSLPVVKPT